MCDEQPTSRRASSLADTPELFVYIMYSLVLPPAVELGVTNGHLEIAQTCIDNAEILSFGKHR